MAETAAGQENLTYIPLSSFIILLVILLTCASRRKKVDAFSAVEQSIENDIKGEYAIMCFPCLRKKPNLKELKLTADLTDQFEYIVEKYTIRKVPLLLANTAEDILERQEELEMSMPKSQTQLLKDDFVNFQVAHEIYNVQRMPPCYTVAANTACPGSKGIKERPRPADVLESMSPIRRSPVKNHNYVVIPTKGSLRHKDIMMTKREITNQYLNNFSSVFVDNLKDQVPKDPEQLPGLSRPYTSAFKNFPIPENSQSKSAASKKSKKYKSQKVAYAFPSEETDSKIDDSLKEPDYDSDSAQDQTTDLLDSEYQEDIENETENEDKLKSLALVNDSDSLRDDSDSVSKPYKTVVGSTTTDSQEVSPAEDDVSSYKRLHINNHRIDWTNNKNVTYEDIQALDVGYEFKSCEKLGVKPQMTRIHYPLPCTEAMRFKDSLKQLGVGDSASLNKRCLSQDQSLVMTKTTKSGGLKTSSGMSTKTPENRLSLNLDTILSPSEKSSSKSIITETSFLPKKDAEGIGKVSPDIPLEEKLQEERSESSLSTKSERSKTFSFNELVNSSSAAALDSVTEISKLYELSMPVTQQMAEANAAEKANETSEQVMRLPMASKSRSLHCPDMRKEGALEAKGNDHLPYTKTYSSKNVGIRVQDPETETSCSLYSRESKTSTAVTSPRSSEVDDGKRATLRWKIVIKHHREEDPSRRNVNVNIKH